MSVAQSKRTRVEWRAWNSWGAWHQSPIKGSAPLHEFRDELPIRDEYGLGPWAQKFPKIIRYYVSIALRATGGSLDEHPQSKGYGTVPELVVMGGLLLRHFQATRNGFFGSSARAFTFQTKLLGGRQPGGAVSDFVVFNCGITTAVRVNSIYHSLENPFGGVEAYNRNLVQGLRLWATNYIDRVIDVNLPEKGFPLENGPDSLVLEDFRRILGVA